MALLRLISFVLMLASTVKAQGLFMTEPREAKNGNIVIKMNEEYLVGQKQALFRDLVKELEKFRLSDVTIRQKTEYARLTAFMN
jgi:hypothetical protein